MTLESIYIKDIVTSYLSQFSHVHMSISLYMLEIARQFVSYRSENLHTSIHPISCELVETADIASLLDIAALQTD